MQIDCAPLIESANMHSGRSDPGVLRDLVGARSNDVVEAN